MVVGLVPRQIEFMRSTIHGLRIAVVALAGYWTLLFISTHMPAQGIMQRVRANDKVLHVLAFSGLAFLIAWAIPTNKNRLSQNVVIAAAVGVIYGGIDELLQIPVGRTADWYDFAADCFGILVGLIAYTSLRAFLMRSKIQLLHDD